MGKTVTKIIPKEEVEMTRRQFQVYHRFYEVVGELVETNEKIYDAKLKAEKKASRETKKRAKLTNQEGD